MPPPAAERGSDPFGAVGNGLANTLIGNDAGNVLDGGAGDGTLMGHGGDDVYYVDSAGDLVEDSQGVDEVVTEVDGYAIPAGVENLRLAPPARQPHRGRPPGPTPWTVAPARTVPLDMGWF